MIKGVLRHCTDMEIQRQYVDSHGQSAIGFAFCRLLGFELAPRLKAIARQKLALPHAGLRAELPNLLPVLSSIINWKEIEQQYDEMVKYAAAMHGGIADPEAILRRFARAEVMHPTYKALAELGRANKIMFPVPVFAPREVPPGNPRRPECGRELEQRQQLRLFRQGWRNRLQPAR